MALHAASVEILIKKARFEPEVALGIAEAIEASVMHAQYVTVPILDARLQEVKAETRIGLMNLESKLSASAQGLEAKIDHKFGELDAKIDRKYGELDAKISLKFGEFATLIERTKAELVRWVFLAMLGSIAVAAGANVLLNAFKNL